MFSNLSSLLLSVYFLGPLYRLQRQKKPFPHWASIRNQSGAKKIIEMVARAVSPVKARPPDKQTKFLVIEHIATFGITNKQFKGIKEDE